MPSGGAPLDPQQRRTVGALWALAILFSAALVINDGVAQTLLLERLGVQRLPLMFAITAALDLLGAVAYVGVVARLGHLTLMSALLVLGGAGTLGAWALLRSETPIAYGVLFAFSEVLQTLLKIHWGVVLLDHYSLAAGHRALPVIYTGARVGGLAGGLILGPLARPVGPRNMLLVSGPLLLLSGVGHRLAPRPRRTLPEVEGAPPAPDQPRSIIGRLQLGVRSLSRSPLIRATAVATATMVLCRYGLRYRYSDLLSSALSETELARYYGLYIAIASPVTILLQLLLTSRLLRRVGLSRTNALYALAVPVGAGVVALSPSIAAAVVARVVQQELKDTIKTPLSNLIYGAMPAERRAAARALILGLIVPLATLLASLLLSRPTLLDRWLVPAAGLFLIASLWQNRSYQRTLDRNSSDERAA